MIRDVKVSWPDNFKKTKQRLEIVEALYKAEKPITAQELYSDLLNAGNPIWLSTIYRVLEALIKNGVVQKSAVHESGTALYEIGGAHRHYAVCVGCKQIVELEGCPVKDFLPDLKSKSFHVVGHKLQISGFCSDCFTKHNPD